MGRCFPQLAVVLVAILSATLASARAINEERTEAEEASKHTDANGEERIEAEEALKHMDADGEEKIEAKEAKEASEQLDTDGDAERIAAEEASNILDAVDEGMKELDTDGDARLSQKEMTDILDDQDSESTGEMLTASFTQVDKDGDDLLDEAELAALITMMHEKGLWILMVMEELDTDGDGRLTLKEIIVILDDDDEESTGEKLTASFTQVDKDGDGSLDKAELAALITSMQEKRIAAEEASNILDAVDEVTTDMLDDADEESTGEKLTANFTQVDKDGDGLLDEAELAA